MERMIVLALALVLVAPAMAQTNRYQLVGRIGDARIIRVFENGVFQRCAASNGNAAALLRIAFTRDRAFSLSVPGNPTARPPHQLTLLLGPGGRRELPGAAGHDRAWAEIDVRTAEALMASRGPLVIEYGRHRYTWDTGAPLRDILQALEGCTNRALGLR